MGEYAPITQELRDRILHYTDFSGGARVQMSEDDFNELCYNIDAIHASLERENKRLRKELLAEPAYAAPEKPGTVGKLQAEVTVTSHLDFEGLARDLEEAARAVRSIGGDGE